MVLPATPSDKIKCVSLSIWESSINKHEAVDGLWKYGMQGSYNSMSNQTIYICNSEKVVNQDSTANLMDRTVPL